MTDALLEQRFSFLTLDQLALLRAIWHDGEDIERDDTVLCELVVALADEIDGAAEMVRINRLTPEELDAELVSLGLDPEAVRASGERMKARCIKLLEEQRAKEEPPL